MGTLFPHFPAKESSDETETRATKKKAAGQQHYSYPDTRVNLEDLHAHAGAIQGSRGCSTEMLQSGGWREPTHGTAPQSAP